MHTLVKYLLGFSFVFLLVASIFVYGAQPTPLPTKEGKIEYFVEGKGLTYVSFNKESAKHYLVNVEFNGKPYRMIVTKTMIEEYYAK